MTCRYADRVIDFPEVAPGPDVTVSATAYLTWLRCPDRALARHLGHYDEDTVPTFRGSLAHRVFSRHLVDGPIGDDELTLVCRQEVGRSLNPAMVAIGMKPKEFSAVVAEVRSLYDNFRTVPTDGLRHVEVQIDHTVAPGVRLRGQIDAVFEDAGSSIRLTDWKTGSLGEAEVQIVFYALLWAVTHDEIPATIEAISVASGERLVRHPGRDELEATAQGVARYVSEVRGALLGGTRLERMGNPWCRTCPILADCPEGAATLSIVG